MAILDELVGVLGFDFRGGAEAARYQRTLGNVDGQLEHVSRRAVGFGRLIAGALVGLASSQVIRSAVSFEDAVADIAKVVEGTPAEIAELSDELLRMSRRLPVSAEGLAAIAAEAGAAGIELDKLPGFAEQVALAVVAFDLPAERVGETMAKLGNVFDFTVEEMGLFNDTINHLSNNMAAKAGELLNFTNRAAGAAGLLGITADQLAGVGAALIAAGVVPETAARGLSALATRIQTDAKGVDDALRGIGLSTAEVQRMLAEDGDAALLQIFESLADLDVTQQAEALKALVGQDFSDDFAKFLANPELLAEGLGLANDEAGKLGSAAREFEARAATTSAKWQRLKNVIASIGIVMAGPILDGFKRFADFVFRIVDGIDSAANRTAALQSALAAFGFDVSTEQIDAWVATFAAGFEEVMAVASDIGGHFMDVFGGVFVNLADAWKSTIDRLDVSGLSRVVQEFGVIEAAVDLIKFAITAVGDVLNHAIDGWQSAMSNLDFSGVGIAIEKFDLLGKGVNLVKSGIVVIGDVVKAAMDIASVAVGTLYTNLTNFAEGSVMAGFAERLSGVADTVQGIFEKVSAIFGSSEGQAILTFLGQLVGELTTLFVEIIGNRVLTAIELVVSVIDTLVTALGQLLNGDVLGALTTLFEGFAEVLSIVWESIKSIVNSITGAVERLTGLNITGFMSGIVENVTGAATALANISISDAIHGIANGIVDGIAAIINAAVTLDPAAIAQSAGDGIINAVTGMADRVNGHVMGAVESVKEAFSAFANGDVLGGLTSVASAIGNTVGAFLAPVSELVNSLFDIVGRVFGIDINAMFGTLIDGFTSGFMDIVKVVIDGAKNIGTALYDSIVIAVEGGLNFFIEKINRLNEQLPEFLQFEKLDDFSFADDRRPTTEQGFGAGQTGEELLDFDSYVPPPVEFDPNATPMTQEEFGAVLSELSDLSTPMPVTVDTAAPVVTMPSPEPQPIITTVPVPVVQVDPSEPDPIGDHMSAQLVQTGAVLQGVTDTLAPLGPTLSELSVAADRIATMEQEAPQLIEQTINNDYTKNITNNVTTHTTVNQTVTGNTSPNAAARAATEGANRGVDRALTVNNYGAGD